LIKINIIQAASLTIASQSCNDPLGTNSQAPERNDMFELLVRDVMAPESALMLPPETSVSAAAELMAKKRVGAAMVVERELLVGIFTERDALFRVLARGLDADTTKVREVMTPEPRTVGPNVSYGYALILMQESGFRNAPVVENGKPIGIVTSRNAMDPDLEQFVSEANRREYIRVSH
jgi:CBS domain-containing protein